VIAIENVRLFDDADNGSGNDRETYEGVTCLACNRLHMVNPQTGKVLGAD